MTETPTRTGRRAVAATALLASTVMLGWGATAALAQDATDTIVIARDMDLDTLDPSRAFVDTAQIFVSSVYDRLVDLAPDNRTIVPMIAESWTTSDDQKTFTFKIDPDATFSDGSKVEAKDVKWSFERLMNLKGNAAFLMDGVTSIETPDETSVVVSLAASNSEFLGILTAPYTGILNSDLAAENGAKADAEAATTDQSEGWFLENSAGGGPFVLTSYRPDDELRLTRNENYWRTPAAAAELVFTQTQDAVTQSQMLESGQADIAMQIDADTATNISSPDVTIETVPSFNFVYLSISPGAENLPVPLTPKIRQAIGLALDYDGIIDLTVGGKGAKQAAPIPNGFPGTENLALPERDVEGAKALLTEEGVADGMTLDAAFPTINVYGVDIATLMQKVQQDLAEVGIQLELQPVTLAVWREMANGAGIPISAVFYAPDYFGSGQYVQFFGMTEGSGWAKRAHSERDPSILNPKEGELLAKALSSSPEESAGIFAEIAQEMIDDRIIIPVVNPNLVLAYRSDIEGVRYSACCNLPTAEISRKK